MSIAGLYGMSMFSFFNKELPNGFPKWLYHCVFSSAMRVLLLHRSGQHLVLLLFWILDILLANRCVWYLTVVLSGISRMAYNI